MRRVALLGYGRFGRALTELMLDAGLEVRVLDPHADVPEARRVRSLVELVDAADVVILSVPVAAMPEALRSLRPPDRSERPTLSPSFFSIAA